MLWARLRLCQTSSHGWQRNQACLEKVLLHHEGRRIFLSFMLCLHPTAPPPPCVCVCVCVSFRCLSFGLGFIYLFIGLFVEMICLSVCLSVCLSLSLSLSDLDFLQWAKLASSRKLPFFLRPQQPGLQAYTTVPDWILFYFKFIYLCYMDMDILPVCMSMHHLHGCYL
jgi:hypothetical protein